MSDLATAQMRFRTSPSRATALAYMDAAIKSWEDGPLGAEASGGWLLAAYMQEIRDWLMNEPAPRKPHGLFGRTPDKAYRNGGCT